MLEWQRMRYWLSSSHNSRENEAVIKGRKILGLNVLLCLVPSSINIQQDILFKAYQSKYQNLPIYIFFFHGQMKISASPLPKGECKHPTNTQLQDPWSQGLLAEKEPEHRPPTAPGPRLFRQPILHESPLRSTNEKHSSSCWGLFLLLRYHFKPEEMLFIAFLHVAPS